MRRNRAAASATLGTLALAAMALCTTPTLASAISLGALTSGGSLSSADGSVTFDGFSVSFIDPIGETDNTLANLDLSLVEVELTQLGDTRTLSFIGPVDTPIGTLGHLQIDYHVRSGNGFELIGAALGLEIKTSGERSFASLGESITGDAAAQLYVEQDFFGGVASTNVAFDSPAQDLDVSSAMWVEGGNLGPTSITRIRQDFTVQGGSSPVPEPGAALLFAAGTLIAAARVRGLNRLR